MFFESPVPLHLDVDTLLAPYLYLDKSKFKGDEDGDACFKKFSNEGNGVALKDRYIHTVCQSHGSTTIW